MIQVGSRVEITFGTFEGKQGVVTFEDKRNRSVYVLVDGTKIEIEKGVHFEVKEVVVEESNTLDQFLAQWKKAAANFYWNLKSEMKEVQSTDYEITAENLKGIKKYSDTKIQKILNSDLASFEVRNLKVEISSSKFGQWAATKTQADINFIRFIDTVDDLNAALDNVVEDKRRMFLNRVEKKAGKIVDMSGLGFGADGSINGTVKGEDKTVNVKTVFAGGHSVQCLHYRVMVK